MNREEKFRRKQLVSRIKEWENILIQSSDPESKVMAESNLKYLRDELDRGDALEDDR